MTRKVAGTRGTAVFSDDDVFRYRLDRWWADGAAPATSVTWIMLNPSTADASKDDPTVAGCTRRSQAWGFSGLTVVNLFAFRSPKPADLRAAVDPVGPGNDTWILDAARAAGRVVCAWGNHGTYRNRGLIVADMLRAADIAFGCLAVTGQRQPWHPLYLKVAPDDPLLDVPT